MKVANSYNTFYKPMSGNLMNDPSYSSGITQMCHISQRNLHGTEVRYAAISKRSHILVKYNYFIKDFSDF